MRYISCTPWSITPLCRVRVMSCRYSIADAKSVVFASSDHIPAVHRGNCSKHMWVAPVAQLVSILETFKPFTSGRGAGSNLGEVVWSGIYAHALPNSGHRPCRGCINASTVRCTVQCGLILNFPPQVGATRENITHMRDNALHRGCAHTTVL